jgi:hypothetical protein
MAKNILQATEAFPILPSDDAIGEQEWETRSLQITTKSTTAENVTITLNGDALATVAVTVQGTEVLASGTCTFSGTVGEVVGIDVNNVELMSGLGVDFHSDLTTLAAEVAARINDHETSPNYIASSSGAVLTLTAVIGSGAVPNGFVVEAITVGGITSVDVNMANGVTGGTVKDTAVEIAAADYSGVGTGWTAVASEDTVIFTSLTSSPLLTGVYSLSSATTAVGTFTELKAGNHNKAGAKVVTLYVGVTGDLDVLVGSTRCLYENVPVGFFPVLVSHIYPTTTTATKLIAHSDGGAN